jgi:hypothetical protein
VYEATPLDMPAPDGQLAHVTPFITVKLKGEDDRLFVTAQYRMEASGPVLTRWTYWP